MGVFNQVLKRFHQGPGFQVHDVLVLLPPALPNGLPTSLSELVSGDFWKVSSEVPATELEVLLIIEDTFGPLARHLVFDKPR